MNVNKLICANLINSYETVKTKLPQFYCIRFKYSAAQCLVVYSFVVHGASL